MRLKTNFIFIFICLSNLESITSEVIRDLKIEMAVEPLLYQGNFQEAQIFCQTKKNMEIIYGNKQSLDKYLPLRQANGYWIDVLYDRDKDTYTHSDRTELIGPDWAPGEPKVKGCGVMIDGKWHTKRCTSKAGMVCFKENQPNATEMNLLIVTHAQARSYCNQKGKDLVKVESSLIKKYVNAAHFTEFWVDSRFDDNKGYWVHEDGTKVPGPYDGLLKEDLCVMYKKGGIQSKKCSETSGVLCYRAFVNPKLKRTFVDAYNLCNKSGLHMVKSDTKNTAEAAANYADKNDYFTFWVDATDQWSYPEWLHYDKTAIQTNMWHSGEPKAGQKGNCAMSNFYQSDSARWANMLCSAKSNVLCSFDT